MKNTQHEKHAYAVMVMTAWSEAYPLLLLPCLLNLQSKPIPFPPPPLLIAPPIDLSLTLSIYSLSIYFSLSLSLSLSPNLTTSHPLPQLDTPACCGMDAAKMATLNPSKASAWWARCSPCLESSFDSYLPGDLDGSASICSMVKRCDTPECNDDNVTPKKNLPLPTTHETYVNIF